MKNPGSASLSPLFARGRSKLQPLAGLGWAFLAVLSVCLTASAGESRYNEPYPTSASKKGLQVELVEDALALGVKHAALNFNLAQMIDPKGDTNNPSWEKNPGQ